MSIACENNLLVFNQACLF